MAIVISGVNNNDKITASDGTIDLLSGVNYSGILTAPGFTASNNITAASINVGSNIQIGNVGIITATTLVGDVTGNVTGNVNATSNLLLQIGGSEKFRVGSSGQLGIGGANYGTSGQVLTSGGSGSAATWSTIPTPDADKIIEGNTKAEVVDTGSNGHFKVETEGDERLRITSDGRLLINSTAVVNTDDFLTIKRPAGSHSVTSMTLDATTATGTYANALIFTKSKDYFFNGLIFTSSTGHQGGIAAKMTTNGGSTPEIQMRIGGSSFNQSDTLAMSVHNTGTVQSYYHATSRNGIVQINQVTSTTRYSGSPSSVDLITSSTMTPKTSAPRFLIMIFCPVNTSDDSDAGNGNRNDYFYGRIEYRKNGGGWIECNDQGSTTQQGGYAAHIELSPNRVGNNSPDYFTGNRYRMEHKQATILATNVGDCGLNGTVEFKLRSYSYGGNFIQIGQPHGNGTDDNYGVQPWGFTVFELAPDSNSYTAY